MQLLYQHSLIYLICANLYTFLEVRYVLLLSCDTSRLSSELDLVTETAYEKYQSTKIQHACIQCLYSYIHTLYAVIKCRYWMHACGTSALWYFSYIAIPSQFYKKLMCI